MAGSVESTCAAGTPASSELKPPAVACTSAKFIIEQPQPPQIVIVTIVRNQLLSKNFSVVVKLSAHFHRMPSQRLSIRRPLPLGLSAGEKDVAFPVQSSTRDDRQPSLTNPTVDGRPVSLANTNPTQLFGLGPSSSPGPALPLSLLGRQERTGVM